MDINQVLDNERSFGKFNAVLAFKGPYTSFTLLCDEVIQAFGPSQVIWTGFDRHKLEMININYPLINPPKEHMIVKGILVKHEEQIIVEYQNEQIIIEHLFGNNSFSGIEGYMIVERFINKLPNATLIIGYELDINISAINESIKENINDESLYPIVKVDILEGEYKRKEEYGAAQQHEEKLTRINEYLNLLKGNTHNEDL